MRFSVASSIALLAGVAQAASSWTFSDGTVHKLSDKSQVDSVVSLGVGEKIKVSLTTKEGSASKKPHQAFLILKEASGLEAPFPLTVKNTGKGTVEISHKDLPIQLLTSQSPLHASLVLGSFGSSSASVSPLFDLSVQLDPNVPKPTYEPALRYGKQPEIHHTFRSEPKNPPKIVSIFFALAVVATIPALFVGWLLLGANVSHIGEALSSAPISHLAFFGSIISMEGVFFLYYSSWNLFATLPAAGIVGIVAFLSGTKALGEVQRRRLAGKR
uniref:Ribophorin II C-terminal domain-containing protein n=1 Tax=Bionectria ochroleuca TaxID=29856 RepID=A0A8H7TTM1_BIOOC